MTDSEQKKAAKSFADYWKDKGYEKGESQKFWLSLLREVYGIAQPEQYIDFEEQVKLDHTSFIDGSIPATHVLIEQKSSGKNLREAIKQSDGSKLTPFQQAQRYSLALPYSQRPRWIVTCNFQEFLIYDMEKPTGEPEPILLADLPKAYHQMDFLVEKKNTHIQREMEVSIDAGRIVGLMYDALIKQYLHPENPHSLKSLNMLCVRLVFCLYAEDAGIFGRHSMFHDYLQRFDVRDVRRALIDLFRVLDTKEEDRDPYMDDALAAFPYVNGGLFADENIEIPNFTEEIVTLILQDASENFDWSVISPTIFGAVFESTLNPTTRRSGGMHYTSIENIHKVIDPLFLDDLRAELEDIDAYKTAEVRQRRTKEFRKKISELTFFDPACGSGNFLTETYLSLRRLENEALRISGRLEGQMMLGEQLPDPILVSIGQFYGIEINDFAVTVAKTALWIAESQMIKETETLTGMHIDFLPLKSYANIVEGNALRIDWESVVPKQKVSYIMGNPPFVGLSMRNNDQQNDMDYVFSDNKRAGRLDYVTAWYKKSAKFITKSDIEVAFVSTNSIVQGEQVPILWEDLFNNHGIKINFAHRTFVWNSEAKEKAAVHCVIVGFANKERSKKIIFDSDRPQYVEKINGYLVNADNIFIQLRGNSKSSMPKLTQGNKPWDGGNLVIWLSL